MVLVDMQHIFEKRKANLIDLLENGTSLEPAKQHQVYGAILEIEIFLRTIEHFKQRESGELNFELKK